MKKSILLTFIISISIGLLSFSMNNEGEYKNLKVLPKNITREQMDSTMKHYSKSLGVKCGFCHERGVDGKFDFASDKNEHKEVTRDMMRLTIKINKKYFDNELDKSTGLSVVTCFTCHNGKKHPAVKPPADPDDE